LESQTLSYKECWGYYWRVTARRQIPGIFKWDEDLVTLIEKAGALKPGAEILDLGCAGGDQAKVLAKRGYKVTGVDYVPALIEYAKNAFAKEGLGGDFRVGDMREIDYQNRFDLVMMLSGTFGYFNDAQNQEMLGKIRRALKPGGHAFIDYLPVERFCATGHKKDWYKIEGGYSLGEEWYDAPTSTYRSNRTHIMLDGRIITAADEENKGAFEVLRCYSAREMETLGENAGFSVAAHLTRNHIGNPGYQPRPDEPRGMIVLLKGARRDGN
jgi:SAM-dependent methyltransferase